MTGGTRRCITVSTVVEAEFYADGGFDDILYAYPLAGEGKIQRVKKLHQRLDSFHIMLDHTEQLRALLKSAADTTKPWSVFLEVDTGYGRTGVNPASSSSVDLAREIASHASTRLAGVYVHCGNSYHAGTPDEIKAVASEACQRAAGFAQRLRDEGIACPVVGIGSTPSCSQPPDQVPGINEFHPGNYAFYDLMQHWIGACQLDDIAARVMTRVISHGPERNQIVIDCGFTALSKQHDPETKLFTKFVDHPELRLKGMSQELGIVTAEVDGEQLDFSRYPIGSTLQLLPYHACAVACQHPFYYVVDDNDVCTAVWKPCRGW